MHLKDFPIEQKEIRGFFGPNLIKNLCIRSMNILNDVEYLINY